MSEEVIELGKLIPASTLLMRVNVGSATLGDNTYEMTTSVNNSAPIIRSEQTGKYYCLDWESILRVAVLAGIDEPLTENEKRLQPIAIEEVTTKTKQVEEQEDNE